MAVFYWILFVYLSIGGEPQTNPSASLRVVLDITRGVQKGCVLQDDKEIHCFHLSGGRNQAQTYGPAGRKVRYCSFTTAARELTPLFAQRVRHSEAFNHGLEYFVSFDEARGVGTHTGDISTYSGSCVRLHKQDAKFLYNLVRDNSVMSGEQILSTSVRYDVIDNTPGRLEAECDCVSNYLQYETVHKKRAEKICNGTLSGEEILQEGLASLDPDFGKPKIMRPVPRPNNF